ncbi:MAG: class II fructose-bisphosphate aldolase [Patescibacteria group bacterium]|jgi:tagatose 1,6-diphosphate aldolase GatY/KbaY
MPLLNLKEAYQGAKNDGYAIGAFNVYNLETVQVVVAAAKKMNSPVIIQTTPSAIDYAGLPELFGIIKSELDSQDVFAAIHLDHARDFGIVKECIDIGYNSVMIDASKLPYESNIALTKKVVSYAKEFDVDVEAELGVISREEGGELSNKSSYTHPDLASDFINRTGITSLAVSVGNEHGAPRGEKLDISLLSKIAHASSVPIVIHGASGLSQKDIKAAIAAGAVKFNIDTKIRKAFLSSASKNIDISDDPRDVFNEVKADIEKLVCDYITLFGSRNKAKV